MIINDLKHKSELERIQEENNSKYDFFLKEEKLKSIAIQVLFIV